MHQGEQDEDATLPNALHRTVLQVAELKDVNGNLEADRDDPTCVQLGPSQ